MIDNNILTTILFFISIAVLWNIHFWLYKDFVVDHYRQNLFELRDKLFDEATSGLIEFSHPAYCVLRRTMNGFIRFGHTTGILNILLSYFFVRKNPIAKKAKYTFDNKFNESIKDLDEPTKKRLFEYRKELNLLLAKQLLMESPLFFFFLGVTLIILVVPVILFIVFYNEISKKFKEIASVELNTLESTALSVGRL